MNPNRQNNRCVTPGGPGFGGRMGGKQIVGPGCNAGVSPASASGCVVSGGVIGVANNCGNPCGAVNTANDCCDPCGCVNVVNDCGNPCGVVGSACDGVQTGAIVVGQSGSACNPETSLIGMPIAMAYVPWQSYGNIYTLSQALKRGTMFCELDLDFAGRRCN